MNKKWVSLCALWTYNSKVLCFQMKQNLSWSCEYSICILPRSKSRRIASFCLCRRLDLFVPDARESRGTTRGRPDCELDRRTGHTPTFTHYCDRSGSRKVCQEYQTNVPSEGNHPGTIAASGLCGQGEWEQSNTSGQTGIHSRRQSKEFSPNSNGGSVVLKSRLQGEEKSIGVFATAHSHSTFTLLWSC